ncbi:serine hydrolase [Sphingomonas lenta]|uniref:beta-lactamase n=1 Tax=Sphingomonas lenta TaxID=1141887 RepID=A0A2A2SG65_9SPHN|nr:serine hydrolase [Sphingomonas lenta]
MIAACAALASCVPEARPSGTANAQPGPRPTATAAVPAVVPVMPPAVVSMPVPPPTPRAIRPAPQALIAAVEEAVRGFDGLAGAAVRAVDDGWTVEANGRRPMPQQSVSKLWVALTLMEQRDQGRVRLDDPITITRGDLTLFHQPIAYLVAKNGAYTTTVGDLLNRALTQSDNTANDRLLTLVGGPGAVRDFIANKRLGEIRFGPGERLLQAGTAGLTWRQEYSLGGFSAARAKLDPAVRKAALDRYVDNPPDGAAPLAIADALARLARGELLSESSTRIMLDTMGRTVTGRARLRAAMPVGWKLAHKTGTGQDLGGRNAGFNDVGLLTAPDGRRYAIAVMIGDTRASTTARQQLIQTVARAVTLYGPTSPATAGGLGIAAN